MLPNIIKTGISHKTSILTKTDSKPICPKTPSKAPSTSGADPSGATKPPTRDVEGELGTATGAAGAAATAKSTSGGDGLRADKFAAPSPDGSIRAPLPKWMAYVWSAIALAWPELAAFIDRWDRDGARLLLASNAGPTGSHGVAARAE